MSRHQNIKKNHGTKILNKSLKSLEKFKYFWHHNNKSILGLQIKSR
jgi:hypothetical protein